MEVYSVLLNLLTGQVVQASMYPLALLSASLPPRGVSSPLLCCCSQLWMFAGLPKSYAMESEKPQAALGRDVQWFTYRSRQRNQRSLYPFPHLSELLQALL